MTYLLRGGLGLVFVLGTTLGCHTKTSATTQPSPPATASGQETLDLPPAQQAARQAYVLGYLLKMPSDYTREAEIEIDVDNVEDELRKIRAEIAADEM